MAPSTAPATPTVASSSSTSPSSTPATSVQPDKPASPSPNAKETETLTLDSDEDEDADMKDADDEVKPKGKQSAKRKGDDSPTSQPSKKKAKSSSDSSSTAKPSKKKAAASTSTSGASEEKKLVEINLKTGKLVVGQKALKTDVAASYLEELASFTKFAVKLFQDDPKAVLDTWPEEHHGLLAKLIHESTNQLDHSARGIKKTLAAAVDAMLSGLQDSQEDSIDVEKRIPIGALKTHLETLATRTNYGLSPSDLEALNPPVALPEGVKDVPNALAWWCFEVEDRELLSSEFAVKLEKRRAERAQIKQDAVALFAALTPEQQADLLTGKKGGKSTAAADKPAKVKEEKPLKGKGKAKAAAKDAPTSDAPEKDGEEGEGEEEKPKPKKAKKEKELTDEQKAEAEDKARKKAEAQAEKEQKRKEKEQKREEKERVKAEKEAEEQKKIDAKKKQSSMFTNFFTKTSPVPEASSSKASSATPSKDKKDKKDGFDEHFFPFNVRANVELAKVCRDSEKEGRAVEVAEEGAQDRKDLLSDLRRSLRRTHICRLSRHADPPLTVRDTVDRISDATLGSEDASACYALLNDRSKVAVKFLKFHKEDRPGYIGTWTKTSRVIGFRTPFALEKALLNYEYDSADEWEEEPEGGEDLNSDGGSDDGDDAGDASEADSWLAEDDEIEFEEGYDAEDDVVMMDAEGRGRVGDDDDLIIVEDEKERKKKDKAKKKRAEEQKKKQLRTPARVVIKGLAWEDEEGKTPEPVFRNMQVQFLNNASAGLDPFTFVSKPFAPPAIAASSLSKGKENVSLTSSAISSSKPSAAPVVVTTTTTAGVNILKPKRAAPAKPFPAEQLSRFVRFLHGSELTRPILLENWHNLMKGEGVACTKAAAQAALNELQPKKVKGKLVFSDEVLAKHGVALSA
ncbi:hypothetical protein JCM10207_004024 [Rhodosporidiobolus poonsookiae]